MPSPFPGMDPFIEAQRWPGFHHLFVAQMARMLIAELRPRYEVSPEERIYIESTPPDRPIYRAGVALSESQAVGASRASVALALDMQPTVYTLQMEEREPYLVVRKTGDREVVTVIEVISPTNKRPGSDGRKEYFEKRRRLLSPTAHLVEIDLLLAGQRLPTLRPLKTQTDYCAFVCRVNQRPQADVFEWTVHQRLPRIPVPLAEGDADAILDLQAAFNAVYDEGGYDYSLQYAEPLNLPLHPGDEEWLRQVLAARASG